MPHPFFGAKDGCYIEKTVLAKYAPGSPEVVVKPRTEEGNQRALPPVQETAPLHGRHDRL